ncbi:hypothetical protein GWI33_023298 [Rhynchophorus ferrugineus]|uniref:Uncharacterized protein n=1 Tax=Rhynchophorus ferrugineus TaxID=354439 RepID=A0A834MHE9_RHYFE|nr:hypothetical protein GWI33_023298 [Rhynchophorus ferrugineus]
MAQNTITRKKLQDPHDLSRSGCFVCFDAAPSQQSMPYRRGARFARTIASVPFTAPLIYRLIAKDLIAGNLSESPRFFDENAMNQTRRYCLDI